MHKQYIELRGHSLTGAGNTGGTSVVLPSPFLGLVPISSI